MILAGLRYGFAAWRSGEAVFSGAEEVSLAQEILRRSLEDAYPRVVGEAGAGFIDFEGSATRMSFLGPALLPSLSGARERLILSASPDAGHMSLILESRPEVAVSVNEGAVVAERLVERMESFTFSYLADGETSWRDQWSNEARLPALIRIEGEPRDGDRRRWPTFIVRPRTDVDAACRFDPLTKYCQGRR